MKTRLLRKVRRNYRIVINDYGKTKAQVRSLFLWTDLYDRHKHTFTMYEHAISKPLKPIEQIELIIGKRYSRYKRKNKIGKIKSNNWTKTWHNKI